MRVHMNKLKHILMGCMVVLGVQSFAQVDTLVTNQDAIYNRPFIGLGESRTAVGGYLEGNTNYFSEDGVSEGLSMELRRFNIFLYAPVGQRIRFLSELEFEHGTEEIALETAQLDFEINPQLNFRAGIILPSVGYVNTNHDSPNWEFVERPISSTDLIPTTLSEVGFGLHGKLYPSENSIFSYGVFLTNGLQDGVILNTEGRTNLASGKTEELFAEDNNGVPMMNGRVSYAHRSIGELGLSYYGGVYNTFRIEGEEVDVRRQLSVISADYSFSVKELSVRGEVVSVAVDIPDDIEELYGEKQLGGFVDFVYPIYQKPILRFENAMINAALRIESADFNQGAFSTNIDTEIGDEVKGFAVGLSFHPKPGTLIRANYRYHLVTDVLGNPAARLAGFQFGLASYF